MSRSPGCTGSHRRYEGTHRRVIQGLRQRRADRVLGTAVTLLLAAMAALAAWAITRQGIMPFLH